MDSIQPHTRPLRSFGAGDERVFAETSRTVSAVECCHEHEEAVGVPLEGYAVFASCRRPNF